MKKEKQVEKKLHNKIFLSMSSYYTVKAGNRWLQVRLQGLSIIV